MRPSRWGRNKYGAKKVTVGTETFDSHHEYERWCQLKLLVRAGKIHDLHRQVKFELIPTQYEAVERYGKTGKRLKDGQKCLELSCDYIADFVYWEGDKMIVEDAKSDATKTDAYVIKRKLMLERHGIRIREV